MKLAELAQVIGAQLDGDPAHEVTAIMPLEWAGSSDVSFYANPKYLDAAKKTGASALIVAAKLEDGPKNQLIHCDPYLAAAKAANAFHPPERRAPEVHPTAFIAADAQLGAEVYVGPNAVIESGASIGARAQIWAQAYVGPGASVGEDSTLHPGVRLLKNCNVGARCVLHAGVVIGGDGFGFAEDKSAPAGKRRVKVPQLGLVVIGDDVEIGANTTIDRATFGMTHIGNGTKIDNLVMIAHNVQTGPDCVIVSQAGISGSTKLGARVILGGQAGIVGHIKLGDDVMVNAQAGVNKSLEAGAAVSGSPSLPYKDWVKQQMALRSIDALRKKVYGIKQ